MRNIADKTDNVSTLSAAEFNASIMQELENTVTNAGITLDGAAGPDTNDEMLGEAVTRTAQGAMSYTDGGAADAYVLTAQGGFVQPSAYTAPMLVLFQAGNTNTGASTVNVAGVGVTDLKDKDGTALAAGAIVADSYYIAKYDLAGTEFRVVIGQAASDASGITLGTPINTTSGTSIDFTSIPADVKRMSFSFSGVSTNGNAEVLLQLGDSGGVETSGYLGATTRVAGSGLANISAGVNLSATGQLAQRISHGFVEFVLVDASTNTWAFFGELGRSDASATMVRCAGTKSLTATLDRVRLTTVGGSDTFDAGKVNIQYQV